MRVLITGGAGFIGSHLAEELLKENTDVFIIDDLSTGRLENIAHLKAYPNFHCVIDTIMNEQIIKELMEKTEQVYHLAAAVGVRLIVSSPVKTIETNILGTEIILKYANYYKNKVFITSTSEIYGKSINVPFKEDADIVLGPTIRSRWSYAASKAIDEFLALAYYKEKKLPVVIGRLFNTVGERQTDAYGMVMPKFVKQALLNQPITIYGDGKQTRTFIYVKDTVEAMVKLMNAEEAIGQIFNIGGEEEITIEELAYKVKKLLSSNSKIIYVPYEEAYEEGFEDMQRRRPDISKLKNLIGFNPKVSLDEIIIKMSNFFKG